MRTTALRLILTITFSVTGACGSREDNDAAPSTGGETRTSPAAAAEEQSAPSVKPVAAVPEVSRTREGNGGIIAIAGELTSEFDYAPPQGRCKVSEGKFFARGIGIDADTAEVSINYESIVAPDTGNVVGQVFQLEVRKDGYVPWSTQVGTGAAGSVEDISQDVSPGGGVTLNVTGTVAGFQKNRAPTGTRAPFRLEATCEP